MKKAISWFSKLAGWLKTLIVIAIIVGVVLVALVIYNLYKSIKNGAKGLTDMFGLSQSDAAKHATADVSASAWTTSLYAKYPGEVTLSQTQFKQMAKDIYDSWGFFSKDFDKTLATIKKCHNKVDVSALVKAFTDEYNKDLVSYISPMKWTFDFRNYPTDAQFEMIHTFVNSLPND